MTHLRQAFNFTYESYICKVVHSSFFDVYEVAKTKTYLIKTVWFQNIHVYIKLALAVLPGVISGLNKQPGAKKNLKKESNKQLLYLFISWASKGSSSHVNH